MQKKKILITGGLGYLGSHTAVELMRVGHEVVLIDNLSNSSVEVLARLKQLCGPNLSFTQANVRDSTALDRIFSEHKIWGVFHFAGFKSVVESMTHPMRYFENNICSTVALLQAMERAEIRNLIFSSSATVYGDPECVPVTEKSKLQITNPYGRTKLICEDMLSDLQFTDPRWHIAILRYFNPVGAHESGLIGEQPNNIPNNLMPYITQVAAGKLECLNIFGNDYPTLDGTGIRDYIHVVDVARGHLAALRYLEDRQTSITANLGTGRGVSVMELVDTFSRVNKLSIRFKFLGRRHGDVACCFADPTLANHELGWKAELSLERMCLDAWRWQSQNPNGY